MISFPNSIRFRFRDSDSDAQVVLSQKDYDKLVKGVSKTGQVSKEIAKQTINLAFYNEIVRAYGKPSHITLVLDQRKIVVH